jgi:hypothetical protein
LIDVVGEDEAHPLAPLMEVVGVLIEKYEDENVPELTAAQPWGNRPYREPAAVTTLLQR